MGTGIPFPAKKNEWQSPDDVTEQLSGSITTIVVKLGESGFLLLSCVFMIIN